MTCRVCDCVIGDGTCDHCALEQRDAESELLRQEIERLRKFVLQDADGDRVTQGGFNALVCQNESLRRDNERLKEKIAELRGSGSFIVNTGDDYEYCETEAKAIAAARHAIQDWRGMCDPEWPEYVEGIWIARIVHEVQRIESVGDDGVEYWDYEIAEAALAEGEKEGGK